MHRAFFLFTPKSHPHPPTKICMEDHETVLWASSRSLHIVLHVCLSVHGSSITTSFFWKCALWSQTMKTTHHHSFVNDPHICTCSLAVWARSWKHTPRRSSGSSLPTSMSSLRDILRSLINRRMSTSIRMLVRTLVVYLVCVYVYIIELLAFHLHTLCIHIHGHVHTYIIHTHTHAHTNIHRHMLM